MKTTLDIPDDVFLRTKKLAQEESRTFKALVLEGLRWVLASREKQSKEKRPFKIVTFRGNGLTPEAQKLGWAKIIEMANEREGS